jgi:hypothetical protein
MSSTNDQKDQDHDEAPIDRKANENRLNLSKVEEKIKTSFKEVNQKVENFKNKVITSKEVQKMASKFETFMQRRENPSFLIKMDELKFTFGVIAMFFTFGVVFYPHVEVLAYWVTFINILLIVVRFIEYKSKKWHYYFFDYCYFVNLGSWIYVIFFPKSPTLFFMTGMNALGPLLNYFVIFKPKLIYQSREAVTSFTMHYTPSLLYWVLRYHNKEKDGRFISVDEIRDFLKKDGLKSQMWVFFLGISFYAAWVVFYYIFIFHIRRERIKEQKYQTLYSYTVEDFKRFNKLILRFGPDMGPICYSFLHLTQGLIGVTVSMLLVNLRWFCPIALAFYLVIPIWNSSVYYFEYFSKDYHTKINRKATDFKEKRMKQRSTSIDATTKRKYSEEIKGEVSKTPEVPVSK